MVTVYHTSNPNTCVTEKYPHSTMGVELVAIVTTTGDPVGAFDHVIHGDGENWTADPTVVFFGDPRSHCSSQEGDVFVASDGTEHLVLPIGFRLLKDPRLAFLP